jgi:hypothetical protein
MDEAPDLFKIEYLSPAEEVDPENDNIDIRVHLADGRVYVVLVATPNNIFRCMDNEGTDYFFGVPPLFVRILDPAHVECGVEALVSTDGAVGWMYMARFKHRYWGRSATRPEGACSRLHLRFMWYGETE